MNKSNDLLNLEKRLENNTSQDLVLNKFKFNKPEISNTKTNPNLLTNVSSFLEKLKASNDELLNNPQNIEKASIESDLNKYKSKYIEMNLGLGVLDIKPKEEIYTNVINNLNGNAEEDVQMSTEELLNFIMDAKKKPKKRLRKIKK
jgi:O-phosphoseryl-tRNA(Cys) synthetase